jgi:predicted dehydrogenase
MEKSRLRFGLIGAGFGARVHLPALRLCPEVELVGAVARGDQSRRALEAAAPGLPLFAGGEELIASGLDGLICALPPAESPKIIERALAAGCGVFAEKPLSISPSVSERLAVAAQGIPNMVNYSYLGLDLFQDLRKKIVAQTYGELRSVQVRWTAESLSQKNRHWNWKTDAAAGGGVFAAIGAHFVAMLLFLLGEPLRASVFESTRSSRSFTPPGAKAAADTFSWISEHPNGVLVSSLLSNAHPGEPCQRWELVFDRAVAVISCSALDYYSGMMLRLHPLGGEATIQEEPQDPAESAPQRATRSMLRAFIAQYSGGERTFSDFAFGALVDRWMAGGDSGSA